VRRYFTDAELGRLRELREAFLSFEHLPPTAGEASYWESDEDLELYERTFGARIGWKWDAVLQELRLRERLPRAASLLDWGCGGGVGVRRYLAAAGTEGIERVHLWDRSPQARAFAARALRAEHPGLQVLENLPEEPPGLLLVSHVLDELSPVDEEPLLALAEGAGGMLWVEPGSQRTSRRLAAARERLLRTFDVLAPCTHQAACGLLAPERGSDWCHHFARPAPEAFTSGEWREFSLALGIDLRSLPYSFLALARRGAFERTGPALRLIGRPHMSRGRAELDACGAEGVRRLAFLQRFDKALFKRLGAAPGEPWVFDAVLEGQRITELRPLGSGEER